VRLVFFFDQQPFLLKILAGDTKARPRYRIEPFLRDASTMWIADYMDVYEGGTKLAYPTLTSVGLSPEGDTSFTTYEDALAHVTGPLIGQDMSLLATQGALDAFFDYRIQSEHSRFSLHPRFDRFGKSLH